MKGSKQLWDAINLKGDLESTDIFNKVTPYAQDLANHFLTKRILLIHCYQAV